MTGPRNSRRVGTGFLFTFSMDVRLFDEIFHSLHESPVESSIPIVGSLNFPKYCSGDSSFISVNSSKG